MGDFNFNSLEPKIRNILTAKDVDLSTISAKRVRGLLVEEDNTNMLTAKFVRDNKVEIGKVISRVFDQVNGDRQDSGYEDADEDRDDDDDDEDDEDVKERKSKKGSSSGTNGKRKKTNNVDEDEDEEIEDEDTPPVKKKKKNGQEKNDEKLARKLSSEINGRTTRGATSSGKAKSGGVKKSRKKSSTTVDSDGEDGTTKKKRGGGFKKEYILSEPLSGVLQVDKLSRPQVVKQLWDYIKGNSLQNPQNKREIVCDSSLKAVFGVEKIDMFKMNKVLGEHLHEPEAAS